MLDYQLAEKSAFTIVGIRRAFHTDTSYQEVPAFWQDWMADPKGLKGFFGVCLNMEGKNFDYWIADLYEPWAAVPPGCETHQIPAGLWAEFRCKGPLPDSLQQVNSLIWSKWLPSLKGYALAGNYMVELYLEEAENPEDRVSYIWLPLRKTED